MARDTGLTDWQRSGNMPRLDTHPPRCHPVPSATSIFVPSQMTIFDYLEGSCGSCGSSDRDVPQGRSHLHISLSGPAFAMTPNCFQIPILATLHSLVSIPQCAHGNLVAQCWKHPVNCVNAACNQNPYIAPILINEDVLRLLVRRLPRLAVAVRSTAERQ